MHRSTRRLGGMVFLALLVMSASPVLTVGGQAALAAPEPKPAILDFGRGVCPTCKKMEGVLEKIKAQYGDQVEVRLVYMDKERDLFNQYLIVAIPTQVFLDASGKEVDRHIGLFPEEELVKKLKELKFLPEQR